MLPQVRFFRFSFPPPPQTPGNEIPSFLLSFFPLNRIPRLFIYVYAFFFPPVSSSFILFPRMVSGVDKYLGDE